MALYILCVMRGGSHAIQHIQGRGIDTIFIGVRNMQISDLGHHARMAGLSLSLTFYPFQPQKFRYRMVIDKQLF